MRMLSEL